MNSKERVSKTLKFIEPDRVPAGEWGIDHHITEKVIGRKTYWRNRKEQTLALWDGRRDEVVDSWKEDLVELILKLDHDLVPVCFCPSKNIEKAKIRKIDDETWEDENGNVYRYTPGNDAIMCIKRSKREKIEIEDYEDVIKFFEEEYIPSTPFEIVEKQGENYRFSLKDESILEFAKYVIEKLGREKFIFFRGLSEWIVPWATDTEDFFIQIALKPDLVRKFFNLFTQLQIFIAEIFINLGVDAIMPSADFCDSTGPMVSPESIRNIFLPGMKKLSEFVKSKNCFVMSHNCGNNWKIMDILIEAGYQCYQSIQAKTGSMDIKLLKEKYGEKISLWGGINIETLIDGDEKEVEEEVKYALKYGAVGGGFILGTSNSVAYGTKYENYMKALETLKKYGNYPITI
ncbi:hypothetical protein J7L87_04050 [bacterium]|nr:hypothetical protein [bacterium]